MSLAGIPGGPIAHFINELRARMWELRREFKTPHFYMPVGLVLALDEANGGDATAAALAKRFLFLNAESKNIIDFYFIGWDWAKVDDDTGTGRPKYGIQFSLDAFQSCREHLAELGIRGFGGNADLILLDVEMADADGDITFHFDKAILINLSKAIERQDIPNLGEFFQLLIQATADLQNEPESHDQRVIVRVSDRIGLAMAKQSALDAILQSFGKYIGAQHLASVTVRSLGKKVKFQELWHSR